MEQEEINFRILDIKDIETMIKYRVEFLRELENPKKDVNEETLKRELEAFFSEALEKEELIYMMAENREGPIGFGAIYIQKKPGNFALPVGSQGYIFNMYTIPSFRGRGICKEILKRLIEAAKGIKLKKLSLHASKDGIEIYKKIGFKNPELPELVLAI